MTQSAWTAGGLPVRRRRALGVLSGKFRRPEFSLLHSPAQDGRALKRVLGNPDLGDFECTLLLDRDSASLRNAIFDFFDSAEADDFLFFYFSGHGRKDHGGRLFLASIDTDPQRLPLSAISGEELRDWIDDCDARQVILILDCCYAGAFGDLRNRGSRSRVVLVSAGAAEFAMEGDGSFDQATPSSFAGAFFEGIETGQADSDSNGFITVREAFDYAFQRVQERGYEQVPQIRAAGVGDLRLARSPGRPAELPADLQSLVRNGMPGARQVAVHELTEWLGSADRGRVALAEAALTALSNDPDSRVAQLAGRAILMLSATRASENEIRETLESTQAVDAASNWFTRAVFYEIWLRSFADGNSDGIGDLLGLRQKLPYLQALGVNCLVLKPIFDSPLQDDGYDIANYEKIHSDLGSLNDLIDLLAAAHSRQMHIVLDIVLNHTSTSHPWFQESRTDPSGPFGDFYVWQDTDSLYAEAVVGQASPGNTNWTFDPVRKQYFWHRFSAFEPDLNFDSGNVQEAMARVFEYWLTLGVDGFRLLTAPYLFEQEGSVSEGLEDTHRYLQDLRARIEPRFPGRILISLAEKSPAEIEGYFGSPERGPENHIVMYASLVPRIFLAARKESHTPVSSILLQMQTPAHGGRWGIFLRNGEELALDMLPETDRRFLIREFAPSVRMQTGRGIRRRLAPLVDGDRSLLGVCTALLLSLPGVPFMYYGDEIGMGENLSLPGCMAIRTPMQWTPDRGGGFSEAESDGFVTPLVQNSFYGFHSVNVEVQLNNRSSQLSSTRRMLEIRRNAEALIVGDFTLLDSSNPAVLVYMRNTEIERVLCVFNFSRFPQATTIDLNVYAGSVLVEMSGATHFPRVMLGRYPLSINGHSWYWFRIMADLDGDFTDTHPDNQ